MPQFGFRFPAATLQRFWTMLAHWHGQLWNASRLAQSMGVSAPAIGRYLDALEGACMLRSLQPMQANVMKRLVKSPKVYVRDSGLLLALLDVRSLQQLAGHPVAGALWEGVVIEQLIAAKSPTVQANFYRTARGAEVDLFCTAAAFGWRLSASSPARRNQRAGFMRRCWIWKPTRVL